MIYIIYIFTNTTNKGKHCNIIINSNRDLYMYKFINFHFIHLDVLFLYEDVIQENISFYLSILYYLLYNLHLFLVRNYSFT